MAKLSIIMRTYQMQVFQDEPGGIQDYEEVFISESLIRSFEFNGDLKELTAESLNMEEAFYPSGYDESGSVGLGDYIYNYLLVGEDGRVISVLKPYPIQADEEEDFDITDMLLKFGVFPTNRS